jgi:alanyl aminopeptidase
MNLKNYFQPKVDKFVGAPRALDQVVEGIDLCIANKAAQGPSVAAFLEKY